MENAFMSACALSYFQGGPYHELLQGLLGAYACYRPDVGYVSVVVNKSIGSGLDSCGEQSVLASICATLSRAVSFDAFMGHLSSKKEAD